jgi:hypothetical protein
MTNAEVFKNKKYLELKNVLSSELIKLGSIYALLDEKNDFSLEDRDSPQIHNSHSRYADTLMESFLLYLQEPIEKSTGLNLYPSYSYYRVYRPGADLKKHVDRPSCEISATVTLEYNYQNSNYEWPIFINGSSCLMNPGDLVIYRGCEVEHWRDVFDAPKNSYHIQFFCHYVDINGPYANYKFDKRPFIGFSSEKKLIKSVSNFYLPNKSYISFTG